MHQPASNPSRAKYRPSPGCGVNSLSDWIQYACCTDRNRAGSNSFTGAGYVHRENWKQWHKMCLDAKLCHDSEPYGQDGWYILAFTFTLLFFYNFIVLMGFLPREIHTAFPGESQLWQGHATQPTVHAGCFSVSISHQTLTWTTGSLPCTQMLRHVTAHGDVWTQ